MSTTPAKTPVIHQPPALDHDAMMLARFGSKVCPRMKIERRVVWNLFEHLKAAGFGIIGINDGDDITKLTDPKQCMELIFNLDECWLTFRKPGFTHHVVYIVLGNDGYDCIADWNYSADDRDGFNAAMDAFDGEDYV